MASEYSVNISLNTKKAETDLKKLRKQINNLNKPSKTTGKTKATTQEEKILKLTEARRASMVRVRSIGDQINKAKAQGLNVDKASRALDRAALANSQGKFKLAKASGDAALLELKTLQAQTKELTQQKILRSVRGGGGFGGNRGGGGRRGGGGFDIQSALISGGFPLLFGQGPFVGAAGALGGGIGGMFGQMGGFAGGIAATTVAQTIQAFTVETGKLGAALNDATKDVEAVSAALGITGTEFEKNLKTLQKLGGEEAAFEAARQKMINLIGRDGVDALQKFGKGVTDIGNEFTKSMTMMRSSLAEFIGSLGIFQRLTNSLTNVNLRTQAGRSDDPKVQALLKELGIAEGLEAAEVRLGKKPGTLNKGRPVEEISKELLDLQKSINLENERNAINKILGKTQEQRVKKISDEIALLERSFGLSADEFEIEKQIMQMKEDGEIKDEGEIRNKLKKLQLLQKERQLADETAAAFERMSQSIATDISQGIQGLIRGTSTLNDMLNNVLNKLIDAAFNMALFGNMQGTLGGGGLFGSIFGGLGSLFGGGGGAFGGAPLGPLGNPLSQHTSLVVGERAGGGSVKGGSGYLVGERGPELFTPGVSGMVTPNHALGGSTSIVVNVDATGSNVEGDEQEGRELGKAISVAVQSELIKQKRPGGLLA